MQLKDVTPIIKAILEERDKIPRIIDKERYIPNPQPYHDGNLIRGGIRKALRIIERAPVVDAMPRWISVEESLPETCAETRSFYHSVTVFASENGRIMMGYFTTSKDDGSFDFSGVDSHKKFYDFAKPSHWMPLPEPPKEESTC